MNSVYQTNNGLIAVVSDDKIVIKGDIAKKFIVNSKTKALKLYPFDPTTNTRYELVVDDKGKETLVVKPIKD